MPPTAASLPARRFIRLFLATALLFSAAAGLFVALIDPYGVSPLRLPAARPIMDINQRYMYPQVARSGKFDSAVFGTSTIRLLDPPALDAAFGGRFANLAMNAATPWEQLQLAGLFLRENPRARTLIMGVDSLWCEPDADRADKRITFRSFPESFYDDNGLNDIPHLFNLKSIEIAFRLVAFHLGLAEPRIRDDGYEYFLPPEAAWTLPETSARLWGARGGAQPRVDPAVRLSPEEERALRFPAVDWLPDFFAKLPASTRLILLMPPIHVAGHPPPGSREDAIRNLCNARIVQAVKGRAAIVEMQFANALTADDANYWDALHFRIHVAEKLPALLVEAAGEGAASRPLWRRLDR